MQKVDIIQPESITIYSAIASLMILSMRLIYHVSAIIDDHRSWFQFSQWLRPQSGQTAWFAEMDR